MSFRKYKEIGQILEVFDLGYKVKDFISVDKNVLAPAFLKSEISYTLQNLPYKVSEAAIGEMIIFPILREVWKGFDTKLTLWSHKSIKFSTELSGIPDYMIAKQSKRGIIVLDTPLLAVVEAKKDDFAEGWTQCLLEMYTIQQINKSTTIPVFGIVSNGDNWEFGYLQEKLLIQHSVPFNLFELDVLFSSLHFIMNECVKAIE
jgi:hypothetical protein